MFFNHAVHVGFVPRQSLDMDKDKVSLTAEPGGLLVETTDSHRYVVPWANVGSYEVV